MYIVLLAIIYRMFSYQLYQIYRYGLPTIL